MRERVRRDLHRGAGIFVRVRSWSRRTSPVKETDICFEAKRTAVIVFMTVKLLRAYDGCLGTDRR
jgi:hypothetical protein